MDYEEIGWECVCVWITFV